MAPVTAREQPVLPLQKGQDKVLHKKLKIVLTKQIGHSMINQCVKHDKQAEYPLSPYGNGLVSVQTRMIFVGWKWIVMLSTFSIFLYGGIRPLAI